MNMKDRFTYVYDNDVWGGSGGGSNPQFLGPYFDWLNKFIKEKKIKTVLDYGCGMSGGEGIVCPMYYGYDVVESVIEYCMRKSGSRTRKYFTSSVPTFNADLIIIKDVLMHWSYSEIELFLKEHASRFKYVVLVNSCQQTEDYQKCSETPHLSATPLNHKFLPLSKYSPELIMTLDINPLDPKEVLLITNNNL
jgi:hypothetical protein